MPGRTLTAIAVAATLQATLQNVLSGGGGTPKVIQGLAQLPATALTVGTSANQADVIWGSNDRALADLATETIDLVTFAGIDIGAGAGKDALGLSAAMVEVVGLLVVVTAGPGSLLIGGEGSTHCWNSILNGDDNAIIGPLPAGGMLLLFNPANPAFAVADVTNHRLKFAATGGAITYSPYLLGRSA